MVARFEFPLSKISDAAMGLVVSRDVVLLGNGVFIVNPIEPGYQGATRSVSIEPCQQGAVGLPSTPSAREHYQMWPLRQNTAECVLPGVKK